MSDLSALRERVEKAEGPDRELDLEIAKHFRLCAPDAWYNESATALMIRRDDLLQWGEVHPFGSTTATEILSEPLDTFTASIDAALALVERELPGRWHSILTEALEELLPQFDLGLRRKPSNVDLSELPLAILAALLRAKEEQG